jgi:hypothetical protein
MNDKPKFSFAPVHTSVDKDAPKLTLDAGTGRDLAWCR